MDNIPASAPVYALIGACALLFLYSLFSPSSVSGLMKFINGCTLTVFWIASSHPNCWRALSAAAIILGLLEVTPICRRYDAGGLHKCQFVWFSLE